KEFEQLFRLTGLVTLVVPPHDLVAAHINHHRLHRRRADVEAGQVSNAIVVDAAHASLRPLGPALYNFPVIRLLTCRAKLAPPPATSLRRGTLKSGLRNSAFSAT